VDQQRIGRRRHLSTQARRNLAQHISHAEQAQYERYELSDTCTGTPGVERVRAPAEVHFKNFERALLFLVGAGEDKTVPRALNSTASTSSDDGSNPGAKGMTTSAWTGASRGRRRIPP
jgi:hypothetical protein